ncbi:MAG: hypothetical protein HY554_03380 [Elusimicrobia bacterium]|nr:hypothetical protein [Elusimicrobiota bacterium]
MSAICVFTPIVVELAWPSLAAAIAASLSAAGYRAILTDAGSQEKGRASQEQACRRAVDRTVEFEAGQASEMAEGMGEEEQLLFEKDGLSFAFRRSNEGKLKVCVTGPSFSDAELEAAGTRALNVFLQDHVRSRVTQELKKRGFSLEEERLSDGTVRLKARRFE